MTESEQEFDYESFDFNLIDAGILNNPSPAPVAAPRLPVIQASPIIPSDVDYFGMKIISTVAWADGSELTEGEAKVFRIIKEFNEGEAAGTDVPSLIKAIAAKEF